MNVVWFAEIKWEYLRTRKQQIVLRRPHGVDVVFFEPYVKGRENRFDLRSVDGIRVATVPFVKSIPGRGPLRALLDRAPARRAVDAIAVRRVRAHLDAAGVRPAESVFVFSNIYALPVARALEPRRLVYDCNDAHGDFPGAPEWARAYRDDAFRAADAVVVSAARLRDDAVRVRGSHARVEVIGNGVDFAAFRRAADAARGSASTDDTVRVGYLGAIAPWLDFELIAAAARARPRWSFDLVGPVIGGVEMDLAALLTLGNVRHRPAVAHERVPEILLDFTVGVIPFRRTPLTAGVNPNKLYEYLAVGLPAVATPFSPETAHYAGQADDADTVVAIANDANELVKACEAFAAARRDPAARARISERAVAIAAAHDWKTIAAQFWRVIGNV
ncbi:MAG TPA: glycosyltransferase [Candidatus Krumholzibacteria bacterium]|nr:glycosyltransferase [Candidatus Krumholzibacteria bacterium]